MAMNRASSLTRNATALFLAAAAAGCAGSDPRPSANLPTGSSVTAGGAPIYVQDPAGILWVAEKKPDGKYQVYKDEYGLKVPFVPAREECGVKGGFGELKRYGGAAGLGYVVAQIIPGVSTAVAVIAPIAVMGLSDYFLGAQNRGNQALLESQCRAGQDYLDDRARKRGAGVRRGYRTNYDVMPIAPAEGGYGRIWTPGSINGNPPDPNARDPRCEMYKWGTFYLPCPYAK